MTLPTVVTTPPLPDAPRPILIVGAGGIVRDAHLPAYRQQGWPVFGIVNRTRDRAEALAAEFAIPRVYGSLAHAIAEAPPGVVYDVALPSPAQAEIIARLPVGSSVLLQKPMGENLDQARDIVRRCRERRLNAAVNFQLRFAPAVIAARHLIDTGEIGDLIDLEIRVAASTPWHLWPFLAGVPHAEVYYHSIHYLDLCRSFLGNPAAISAKSVSHPGAGSIHGTRSTYLLDYGDHVRVVITANHHVEADRFQEAYIQWTGTAGVIRATLGVLLNYPHGIPDEFHLGRRRGQTWEWTKLDIPGSWFPDAFIGPMASVMRAADDPSQSPPTAITDAFDTMRLADAACRASDHGGTLLTDVSADGDLA